MSACKNTCGTQPKNIGSHCEQNKRVHTDIIQSLQRQQQRTATRVNLCGKEKILLTINQQKSKMSKSLAKMECPFTWNIDEQLSKNFDEKEEPTVGADEEPLLALINSTMITYFRAIQGNHQEALENLDTTDAIWKILIDTNTEVDESSKVVLEHVMQATEYFALNLAKRTSQANALLKNLKDASSFQNPTQVATITGCKAVAWTSFHEKGHAKALAYAKVAVAKDPKCALWHYVLGKNLRHARRNEKGSFTPSAAERDAIVKCCQLSNVAFYKIHLAQMYRECKMDQKSKEIYLDIFETNPKKPGILLRLARSFTAFKDFDRAKKCFDEAEKYQKSSMFYHYKGIFYEKQRELKLAAEHFKKAAENGNYRADLQYATAMGKLLRNKFDCIGHLKKMSNKYSDYPAYEQQIYLHIGMQYVFRQSNLKEALAYFLRAIEINPQSEQLKDFFSSTIDWKSYNIYDFVSKKLREFNSSHDALGSSDTRNVVQQLRELCEQHKKLQVLESFDKMKI